MKKFFLVLTCLFLPASIYAISLPEGQQIPSVTNFLALETVDLEVNDVFFDRSTFSTRATIANKGTIAVPNINDPFSVEFELLDDNGARVNNIISIRVQRPGLPSVYTRSIQSGGSFILSLSGNIPGQNWDRLTPEDAARVAQIRVRVRPSASIGDINPNNNELVRSATGTANLPDFVISRVSFDRFSASAAVSINNIGTGTATRNGRVDQRLGARLELLDGNGNVIRSISSDDRFGQLRPAYSMPPLVPFSIYFNNDLLQLNTSELLAIHSVKARVSGLTNVVESDSTNNELTALAEGSPKTADVSVTAVTFDRSSQSSNITVRNIGTADVDTQIGVYAELLDANGQVVATPAGGLREPLPPLAVGQVNYYRINKEQWSLSREQSAAASKVHAWVAPPASVFDLNNQNNEFLGDVVGSVVWPDLVVDSVSVGDKSSPSSINVIIKNNSTEDFTSAKVVTRLVWIDQNGRVYDTTYSTAENLSLNGGDAYIAVSPHKSSNYPTIISVTSDFDKNVTEANEENNVWEGVLTGKTENVDNLNRMVAMRKLAKDTLGANNEEDIYKFTNPKSVPGDFSYLIKDSYRRLRIFFTFNKENKNERKKRAAAELVVEANSLLNKGQFEKAKKNLERVKKDGLDENSGNNNPDASLYEAEKTVRESMESESAGANSSNSASESAPAGGIGDCTADEWNCNWSQCQWVGPEPDLGLQRVTECYKIFDCPNADTPNYTTIGAVRACRAEEPCTEDEYICDNWQDVCYPVSGTQGRQPRTCRMIKDCPNVLTPAPDQSRDCTVTQSCTADEWTCTGWNACVWTGPGTEQGSQTRTCTIKKDCPNVETSGPAQTQGCSIAPSCTADEWTCTGWNACVWVGPGTEQGRKTRTCVIKKDCPNVSTPSPAETGDCTAPQPAPTCIEADWHCYDYDSCSAQGQQRRECYKIKTECQGGYTPETARACTRPVSTNPSTLSGTIPVAGVFPRIQPSSFHIAYGGTITLTNNDAASHTVRMSWNGTVTVLAGGSIVITVPSEEGTYYLYYDDQTQYTALIRVY